MPRGTASAEASEPEKKHVSFLTRPLGLLGWRGLNLCSWPPSPHRNRCCQYVHADPEWNLSTLGWGFGGGWRTMHQGDGQLGQCHARWTI